jgi:hypothetical protein
LVFDSYVVGYVIPCLFYFSLQDMLTVLVPLLLCCVVAHRAESGHQRAQHTVMMDLISTIEVSLAQLKHESTRMLERASRSASGATTLANAPSPSSIIRGT